MKTSTFVAAALTAASAVSAVPVKRADTNFGGIAGPLGGLLGNGAAAPLGDSAQSAVAGLFKVGDEILNIPGDAVRKLLSGDVVGAGTGLVQDVMKAGTDIPKDAMGIVSPVGNAVGANLNGKKD